MNIAELIESICLCVQRGKINAASPYPKDMMGEEGADELTLKALALSCPPDRILEACSQGMNIIGEKFSCGQAYIPELLMSAKAMNAAMAHLKPFYQSGQVKKKGTFLLGTVAGDLHDIGKNLVSMVAGGNGWDVIDMGVDVRTAAILKQIDEHPGCIVGLSALLTTTMSNMLSTVKEIKMKFPDTKIIVGGAPLSAAAAEKMGADAYGCDPQSAVDYLNKWIA